MKQMTSSEIREVWLKYFQKHGHEIISSSSLIPVNDPTLLWINAGVAPLKKYFDGREIPNNPRMTNIQKCVRTNDIENVGKTARHHTFFEMMGNFSIGDYFKKEAIQLAYDLLFDQTNFGFPFKKIYITYYPTDIETRDMWLALGINEEHLIASYENFWEIGAGPSGPSTEIFFDRGEKYDSRGTELIKEDLENDRYVELWNVVFSQFDANPEVPRDQYKELPNRNIDTGAGLERFACIMQNVETNFETDLFMPIIKKVEKISGIKYESQMSFKVIADHAKAVVIALSDGAVFSNEGRGYVLRRLLRRALKHGRTLNLTEPFLYELIPVINSIYGSYYHNLLSMETIITKIIKVEEEKFNQTIQDGEKLLIDYMKDHNYVSGEVAFKLYDTYGYPIELTLEYASDHKIEVDLDGFELLLKKQKELSRKNRNITQSMGSQNDEYLQFLIPSTFVGYDTLKTNSTIIKVFNEGIVVDQTPFYATKGGQVNDIGLIDNINVTDVLSLPNGQHLHVVGEHSFNEGDQVLLQVDEVRRNKIIKNHTATHLLHQVLKDVVGSHANQQGSLVNEKVLRFDFNHYENITSEQVLHIETLVNNHIGKNLEVKTIEMPYEDAIKLGAIALFGEKYDKDVRVVNIGGYSIELCGGTHVSNTKEINNFTITSIESIGSGIYRITAITNVAKDNNEQMLEYVKPYNDSVGQLNEKLINELNYSSNKLVKKPRLINSYQDILNYRNYLKQTQELVKTVEKDNLLKEEQKVLKEVNHLIPLPYKEKMVITIENIPIHLLKQVMDQMFDKIKGTTLLVFNVASDKVTYLCKSTEQHSGNIIKKVNEVVNGRGGGKDTFAQGATTDFDSFYNNLPFFEELL